VAGRARKRKRKPIFALGRRVDGKKRGREVVSLHILCEVLLLRRERMGLYRVEADLPALSASLREAGENVNSLTAGGKVGNEGSAPSSRHSVR
jgi:hypothetical protein